MASRGLAAPAVRREARPDGSIILTCVEPLGAYGRNVADAFLRWSELAPDSIAVADRKGPDAGWRTLTYGALAEGSARVGQFLLDEGLGPDRPLMLVSSSRIEGALLKVAAYRAGVPIAPVTPAYSMGAGDLGRLTTILDTLRPGLAVIENAQHMAVLGQVLAAGTRLLSFEPIAGALPFAEALRTADGPALSAAQAAITGAAIAKILFTSGSTGTPKGAINTHRMLASNIRMTQQGWPFLEDEPPVVVDWLPWSHTFGGNFVFNMTLSSGGTLYLDDGWPAPGQIRRSLQNNAEVRPTLYINTPRALDLAGRMLSEEPRLAEAFFERLRLIFFASAGLPPRIRQTWRTLIDAYGQRDVAFVSSWGATETAPLATSLNFEAPDVANIGNPAPGVTLKLAPMDGRYELRAKGPNVTPGYFRRPALTAAAFDDEGFFKSGDVARLADEDDPSAGLLVEGRLAEDFKLTTGVWVNVGAIRAQLLEWLGPMARDVVLSGPGRRSLAALVFLDVEHCRQAFGLDGDAEALAKAPAVLAHIRAATDRCNEGQTGSSRFVAAAHALGRALDAAAGELTQKGAVNQAAVLRREAALCEGLDGEG